eukprot:TRINITY_DN13922_c0_g1_i1.p1 TRINITY_DN13922_c0_g1~~TRINITY_DN13922_c0_g1_i1.p1  ORF type:complete len:351 (+),score=53.18 TRINITY_DN13922_c0_g1_i1:236-1288(+)
MTSLKSSKGGHAAEGRSEEVKPLSKSPADTTMAILPLEIMALLADFVSDFKDLYQMMLASRRLRDGVHLSHHWPILVMVLASEPDVERQREILADRSNIIRHACKCANLPLLRAMKLKHGDVQRCMATRLCANMDAVPCLVYLMEEDLFDYAEMGDEEIYDPDGTCEDRDDEDTDDDGFGRKGWWVWTAFPEDYDSGFSCHVNVLRYLHATFGLTDADMDVGDATGLVMACHNGNADVVRYLGESLGLQGYAGARSCEPIRLACQGGHVEVLRVLHETFGVSAEDVLGSEGLGSACRSGHVPTMEYLHRTFGFTAGDVATDRGVAIARAGGHDLMVAYLREEMGAEDVPF